ncbi:lipoate--protein ligase family protein [Rubrobacter aplysinae]|uniref:lipoate--protein ligase family protein n=1 Tax=Rubrobacter aplysinae TaxID=909625 RepID=UPI00128D14FD|nr:lipoate--protein ligase family protein [Rubrobacter aplysinae]
MEVLIPEKLDDPEDGFGLQQAVLEEVGSGRRGPTALLWSSARYVGVTRPETRLTGFEEARERMAGLGFPVLVRNSGGGAVAANRGSLSFSMTFPVRDLRQGLYERYAEGSGVLVSALRGLGVDAEAGGVEREFCPGAYSVRSGGAGGIKVAGLAQRVAQRAARVEALILVSETEEIRRVLSELYPALGLPFRPEGVGDLAGENGPLGVDEVIRALAAELGEVYGAATLETGESLISRARKLRGSWRASGREA